MTEKEPQPINSAIAPVTFTHGDSRTEERGEIRLGKAHLVSRLQALLQTGRLHLPRNLRVDENDNDCYGAFRVGTHNDLVTALGLAVQLEPKTSEIRPFGF